MSSAFSADVCQRSRTELQKPRRVSLRLFSFSMLLGQRCVGCTMLCKRHCWQCARCKGTAMLPSTCGKSFASLQNEAKEAPAESKRMYRKRIWRLRRNLRRKKKLREAGQGLCIWARLALEMLLPTRIGVRILENRVPAEAISEFYEDVFELKK